MIEKQIFGVEEKYFNHALEVVHGLYQIERTGWVKRGVKNPETVGQHVDSLIQLAKKVCLVKKELNQQKLERMLQIHDWPEYKVGDLVTVHNDEKERTRLETEKKDKELAAFKEICFNLGPEGKIIFNLWEEYESGKTPEAKIANQLDKLQAMYQAWEYEKANNGQVSAQEFIDYARNKISDPLLVEWMHNLEKEINKK